MRDEGLFKQFERKPFMSRFAEALRYELSQIASNPRRLFGIDQATMEGSQIFVDSEPWIRRLARALAEIAKNPLQLFFSPPAPKTSVLLDSEPLLTRVLRTIVESVADFSRNPKAFLLGFFKSDPLEARRKTYYHIGIAFSTFLWLLGGIIYLGYYFYRAEPPVTEDEELQKIADLTLLPPPDLPKLPAVQRAGGGGGGGRREMTPPSKGVPPKADLRPPIVAPTTHPPKIEKPSLPVVPTVQVQPDLVPPPSSIDVPIGDPKGIPGPPSDGPGEGGGIGVGKGGGVGSGRGTGLGPGEGFNTGGGSPNIGGDGIYAAGKDGVKGPQILSKVKPRYTEEARRDKIQGVVVLSAVFRKDGTVSDIKVLRGLGYGLDEEAIKAASMIKFIPGTKDGVPVNVRARLEFTFSLL
ncbi:MAG: TonB family protein [Acidobacteriota bacterium]|nr:TonB family protein [Blastocatellia bacterium]MDW8411560.1 TonB family protein [Acidobacteriota bacterium]